MRRQRLLIILSLVALLAGLGGWLWMRFLWVFFVKPAPAGPSLGLPIAVLAGHSDGRAGLFDGKGGEARMNKPIRLAALDTHTLVFADINNHAIRAVDLEGQVRTLAGAPDRKGYQDGPGKVAAFKGPHGVAVRADGAIAVAEASNHTIRLLTPDGQGAYVVSTLAGRAGESGFRDGAAMEARFSSPHAVAWGASGELYIADIANARIRRLQDGRVSTVAGTGTRGQEDGAQGTLNWPMDLVVDGDGSLWIADSGSLTIRRFLPGQGLTTPFPGLRMAMPHGIALLGREVVVAELNGQRVLAFDRSTGSPRVLCGTTEKGREGGRLNRPAAVLVHEGRLWIADLGNHRIVSVPAAF